MSKNKKNLKKKKPSSGKKKAALFTINKFFIGAALLPVLITALIYLPNFKAEWTNWDDPMYVLENPHIVSMSAEKWKQWFSLEEFYAYNYHPLTWASLAWNFQMSQLDASSYHALNIIIHLLNTLLVFIFTYLISRKNLIISFAATLLFGVHPLHVESVAWVTERKDVLYALFYIPALIFYLRYLKTNSWLHYGLCALLFILSGLSKPAAVVFPLALIFIDLHEKRAINMRALLDKLPFFAISIVFGLLTLKAQTQDTAVVADFEKYSVIERLFFANYAFMMYIIKFFIPVKLSAFYPYPDSSSIPVLLSPLFVIGALGGTFWLRKKSEVPFFGLLFYAVNVVLVLQFISVGSAIMAERYTYIPYIGLAYATCWGFCEYLLKNQKNQALKQGALISGTIVLLAFSFLGFQRVGVWHNSGTLWTDTIAKYSDIPMPYNSRGNFYLDNNEFDKAIADYTKAIEIKPDHYKSYTNRGNVYKEQKQYERALADYEQSIRIRPNHIEAYINRANIYSEQGKKQEALADLNKSIGIKGSYEGYVSRGALLRSMGKLQEALNDYDEAKKLRADITLFTNIGNVYFSMNKFDEAIKQYNVVLNNYPNDLNTLANRGAAYFQMKNYQSAIADFSSAIQLSPNSKRNLLNRSYAYNQMGDKKRALQDALKVQSLGGAIDQNYITGLQAAQ